VRPATHRTRSRRSCPTLILRGDGDFLLFLSEASEAQARTHGASFGNIPLAGHAALEESPDIIGRIILGFLLNPQQGPGWGQT
jgi:pimeloyl-ACP methyl ester carboxylesterase